MKSTLLFSLLLTSIQVYVLLFFWGLNHEFSQAPHSVHTWRQCDGAAFGLHYFTYQNALLHPQIYNMELSNGEAVSEFPIVYWLAAKLSGNSFDAANIRWLYFLCSIIALFAVNATAYTITHSLVLSFYISFLPFLSTVFSFYSNNFLPDVPAVAVMLTALSCFYFYYKTKKAVWLALCIVFFSLAGLLKPTSLVPYLVLLSAIFFETLLGRITFTKKLTASVLHTALLTIPLIVSALWILFVKYYNTRFGSAYFRTVPFPIWELDKEDTYHFFGALANRWYGEHFSVATSKVLLAIIPLSILIAFKNNRRLGWVLLLFVALQILIMLLFAGQYYIHDYYAIALFTTPVIAYTVLFYYLQKNTLWRLLLPLIFIPYTVSEIVYTKEKLKARFETQWEDRWTTKLVKCTPHLANHGLHPNDKILVLGDPSSCISLYTLQRKGWTEMNFFRVNKHESIAMMRTHGLTWVVFFPDAKSKNADLFPNGFKKQFSLEGFEFAQL
ncbi:MAG: glycosyltransferase family 39 protein [Chitinophagales bacterium]|nr:glycosyltransferase family 39 protein [Chitinophagales bacterium]